MAVRAPLSALDELARRAAEAAGAQCAWISVFEEGRERVEGRRGVAFTELAAAQSFALGPRAPDQALFVEDAAHGPWATHPLVAGTPHARLVAVLPLAAIDGFEPGALTVIDPLPRALDVPQRIALANLASLAAARIAAGRGAAEPQPAIEREAERRRAAEAALAEERALADAVLANLSGAFFLVDEGGRLRRWNALLAAAVGGDDAALGGMSVLDFISPRDRPAVAKAMGELLEQGRDMAIEAEVVDREGNVRPYAIDARAVTLRGARCMLGMARDITLRRRAERQMARAKERLDLALAGSSLALWDWDLRQDRVYFNENWAAMLGDAPRESTFAGEEVRGWIHVDDRPVFEVAVGNASKGVSESFDCEFRLRNAAGDWIWVHGRGKVTQRGEEARALRMTGTATNITKRKQAEERAEYLATRDALTGLPNRALLHDRLEQAVVNAARRQSGFAFMFIDLDRFKTINDSLGHHAGDELLKGVAARLGACVRASDTVARLGGDEFAVILENLRDEDDGAQPVAEKMIAAVAAPMQVAGQPLATSCSVGISVYPADGRDGATLMKNADVAMYYAKEKGRNNYQFFSAGMNARVQDRMAVESFLRLALRRGELVLHYQPRFEVASGRLAGVEALIRWQHPRRGLLGPEAFVEVAEDAGLMVAIGEWVLEAACAQLRDWQRRIGPLRLSVNLARGQLRDAERLQETLAAAVGRSGIAPGSLQVEVAEGHLMQDAQAATAALERLGGLGIGIAIDDFGTGFSSLASLKRLPVEALKIDATLVRDLATDANDRAVVQAVLAMAHALGLAGIAEGVESAAQLEALRALGCDEYQGFLECPAVTAAELERRYLAGASRP